MKEFIEIITILQKKKIELKVLEHSKIFVKSFCCHLKLLFLVILDFLLFYNFIFIIRLKSFKTPILKKYSDVKSPDSCDLLSVEYGRCKLKKYSDASLTHVQQIFYSLVVKYQIYVVPYFVTHVTFF